VPIPLPEVAGPHELLGHLLLSYQESHPRGSALDDFYSVQMTFGGGGNF
jgi:hypothetical protein